MRSVRESVLKIVNKGGLVLLSVMLIQQLTFAQDQEKKVVYYVSTTGNDNWSGKLARPNKEKTDGPFASIECARNTIRKLKQKEGGLSSPATVMIREGTYFLNTPLVFIPEDSGTRDCPITYMAYPGEKPVITGGERITGWKRGDDKLWTVQIPRVKAGKWYFRQIFVNGERRQRVRMPDKGYYHLAGLVAPDEREDPVNRRSFRFKQGDLNPNWTNLTDVEVVKFFGWSETRLPIEKVDGDRHTCTCAGLASASAKRLFNWFGDRYYVENVFEGLDGPGEWYLNRKTGVLYYWPLPDEDMTEAEVIAPVIDQLIRFEGDVDAGESVEYINLRDMTLSHSGSVFPNNGYREMQSDVFVPGAIYAEGMLNCRLEDNDFAHIGTYVIELSRGCKDNHIVRNQIHDMGGGGIKIGESREPQDEMAETCRNVISDNYVYDGGHIYFGSAGIWVGHSGYNLVSHNEVHDLYGSGISVGWTWAYRLTSARDNTIEYNHIYNIGLGVIGGGSGIYTLARQPGTKIRYNLIHDLVRYTDGPAHPAFGFQVDNGSGEMVFENNVVYNVPDACYKQMGRNHLVRNNIFAFAIDYPILRRSDEGSLTFERNIVCSNNGKFFGDSWKKQNYEVDHNLYWDTSGSEVDFAGLSFEQWQANGHDVHSLYADPLFVDVENGDFTLKPGAPALELGFEPIDLSKVGPRPK